MVHRLSDMLCDCRVMAQKILYSIFACLPCKMHRPIWAEHQPLATSPCPPTSVPVYELVSSHFFIIVILVDINLIPRQAAGQQILFIVEPNWHKQAAKPTLLSRRSWNQPIRAPHRPPLPGQKGIAGQSLKIIKAKASHIPIGKYSSLPRTEGANIPRLHYLNIHILEALRKVCLLVCH